MLTAFDVGVGVLLLISAILATARGFTREILSLVTWAGAAGIAAYLFFNQGDLLKPYFSDELIAKIVLVAGSFLIALIVLHLITMRIADFVVDSRIGPLDRTLGFLFGLARGALIAVVVVIFGSTLLNLKQYDWAANAKSWPILEGWGDDLIAALPNDLPSQITKILGKDGSDEEPGTGPAEDGTDQFENDSPLDAPAGGANT